MSVNQTSISHMKRIISALLLCLICNVTHSQIITEQELEDYTKLGDMSWSAKAKELSGDYMLNEAGELSLAVIKEYKGQSKSQLYKKVLNWIISMSSNANSAIQMSDETEGTIIARCYLPKYSKTHYGR